MRTYHGRTGAHDRGDASCERPYAGLVDDLVPGISPVILVVTRVPALVAGIILVGTHKIEFTVAITVT